MVASGELVLSALIHGWLHQEEGYRVGASGWIRSRLVLFLHTLVFYTGHHGLYQEFLEGSAIVLPKSITTKAEAELALG